MRIQNKYVSIQYYVYGTYILQNSVTTYGISCAIGNCPHMTSSYDSSLCWTIAELVVNPRHTAMQCSSVYIHIKLCCHRLSDTGWK